MTRSVVWRIARRPHALDRLGGGARLSGGRWNHVGTAAIYAGGSVAIAALERFVHLAGVGLPDLVLVRVSIPEGSTAETAAPADLPAGWDDLPPGPASMDFGTRWAREVRSLVLYVPSALVREERNAVLNPSHPEFASVGLEVERDFQYDPRMDLPRRSPPDRNARRLG